METKNLTVYVDNVPTFIAPLMKTSKVGDIKQYFKSLYPKHTIRMFINKATELGVFNTDQYDSMDISSVWNQIHKGTVILRVGQKQGLTGIRDIDMMILSNLSDEDVLNACLTSKEVYAVCKNDGFWRNRFLQRFGPVKFELTKHHKAYRSWKDFYFSTVNDLKEWSDPWDFFDNISWQIGEDEPPKYYVEGERYLVFPSVYHYGNLGKNVTIGYQLDRYGDLSTARDYQTDDYFSPQDIMMLIKDFYLEKVTPEELLESQRVDNPYAEGYTVEDAIAGKITRGDLLGPLFFEGFILYPKSGVRSIFYGS